MRRVGVDFLRLSHTPAILAGLADRILVMYSGRVVEEGPLERVYRAPLHPYTKGLLASMPRGASESPAAGKAKLPAISGSPPDPARLPPGCPFEPRCPDRLAICTSRGAEEVQPEAARRGWCFKYC